MKRIFTIVCVLMSIALASCTYDDTALWTKVNDHESRIAALEELCRETNTNLEALQSLIEAVENADYITSVTPIKEGSDVVGYTITFSKSAPITIYNGTDGKDGADGKDGQKGEQGEPSVVVPEIGIKKDVDGTYYWTIDGKWLTDDNGNKIPAVAEKGEAGADGEDGKDGTNGQDGKDGITPQLKIEGDYWYVSYDEGKTWTQLGRATSGNGGTGADSIFSKVDVGNDSVTFTMLDGTSFTIKFYAKPEITFEGIDEDMVYYEEQEFEISYTVMGGDDETLVESFASGPYWSAIAVAESATTGKINITAGEGDGKVVVIVTTGMGSVTMKSIKFEAGKVVGIDNLYTVGGEAGSLTVEFKTNIDLNGCRVVIGDDWLTMADTRAEMRDETLVFSYTANPYGYERWTWVDIYSKDGHYIEGFEVMQEESAAYEGPALPEDIYPESTSFTHSLLFVKQTGVNCPYCPMMRSNLISFEKNYPEYNDNYVVVECHGGVYAGNSDPAYSAAANVVDNFYNITGYPTLDVNFYTTEVGNYAESSFHTMVKEVFDNYLNEDGADAGISIATEVDTDVIYVSAGIKAAVEQEYKVTAWLLENDIDSPNQAGATKPEQCIYNHALRNIAGSYDKYNIQGESVGVVKVGATATKGFELEVTDSSWNIDNMEVLVIVSALNDDNKWEVVNTSVCPVGGYVDFYGNGTASGGDNDDEEWNVLGDGLFYDDFISWVYSAPAGNCANVTIEESTTRPGYYRMLNPFSEENVAIFIGGRPDDMTYAAEDVYIEIDATDPDAVFIPYQYAGFSIESLGDIYIASIQDSYGTLNNGVISFPMNGLGLLISESVGYYANQSGLFKVVLPGSSLPSYDFINVFVDVTAAGWANCNAWAWDLMDTAINYTGGTWPGVALEATEVNGMPYYMWRAPMELLGSTIGFIVNDGVGQTVDLTITFDSTDAVFVVLTTQDEIGKWLASVNGYEVEPPVYEPTEEPVVVLEEHTWGVIGGFNSWSEDIPMTITDGVAMATFVVDSLEGSNEFKIRADGAWDINYGYTPADGESIYAPVDVVLPAKYDGCNIIVDQIGTYTIQFAINGEEELFYLSYEAPVLSTIVGTFVFDVPNAEYVLDYYGDFYGNGTDNYVLTICEDLDTLTGTYFTFDLVAAAGSAFASSYVVDSSLEEYTIYPGSLSNGSLVGSWYVDASNGDIVDMAPLVEGNVTIEVYNEGYKVTINCYDDAGNNIIGTISGKQYEAPATSQASMAMSKKKSILLNR